MSNLPITTSAPQAAAKPASAAAPAEESGTQGQPFGDVLARQVSDSTTTDAPPAKKASAKSAQEVIADLKADATPVPADPASNLPADMLAALLPQAANVAAQTDTPAETKGFPETKDLSDPAQIAGLPETGLPGQAAQIAVAADASGLPKKAAPAATQAALDTTQGIPAATTKGNTGVAREPLMEAKKDAVFNNIMATMNANIADKLSGADEKTAALAAAPQPNAAAQASMQPAAAPLAPAVVMPAVLAIDTPVNHDKWGDEFNQKITWLASSKEQSAELHLNPPQLGPMDVVLKVNGDQATALFSSPHAAVREAIEQALPKLREMMAESGIMLGNASVNDQAPRNRQNDGDNRASGSRSGIGGIAEVGAPSNLSMRVSPISRHNGIVDTFA